MRAIFFIFLYIISISSLFGQSYDLKVKLKNGNSTSIPINENTKIVFSTIAAVKVEDLKKTDFDNSFSLMQNFPNPFNPNTIIHYQLPNPGSVEIKIFDLNSKCIKTLFNGFQTKGTKNVSWDSRDDNNQYVASGVYLYQIKFDNLIVNKKMLVIK